MKLKLSLIAGAALASAFSLSTWAQTDPTPTAKEIRKEKRAQSPGDPSPSPLSRSKAFDEYNHIRVRNFQDELLGRISDLGIDLANGRIIEVFVESDPSLNVGKKKIVAVPPLAFFPDAINEVYRINVSADVFKSAPEVTLKHWEEGGRSVRVAATYRLFKQEPYFLEEGNTANPNAERPLVALGYVERCNKLLDLPVGNFQNEKFGKVWSMTMDIPSGRILNVIVIAPGNLKVKSIIPAMALSFNAKRDGLLLDDTKLEFADEPRLLFTEASFGNEATFKRESYKGPRTLVALEQGSSYRDVDRTVRINQEIRKAKINGRNVEVGTINDRVTLRGWVYSAEDKAGIGRIAIAQSTLAENVDNQIVVGKPVSAN